MSALPASSTITTTSPSAPHAVSMPALPAPYTLTGALPPASLSTETGESFPLRSDYRNIPIHGLLYMNQVGNQKVVKNIHFVPYAVDVKKTRTEFSSKELIKMILQSVSHIKFPDWSGQLLEIKSLDDIVAVAKNGS